MPPPYRRRTAQDRPAVLEGTVEEVHGTFDPAIGIQLLADIRTAFEAFNTERMTSATMIAELVKDEEAPWVEYGKGGKPITQKKLADLLKEFGIRRPHNVRPIQPTPPARLELRFRGLVTREAEQTQNQAVEISC